MFTPFAFIQPVTTVTPIVPTTLQYLLVGGGFLLWNNPQFSRIAKIDENGNIDPSFNMGSEGFTSTVIDIKQQPDGKYVVGGSFTAYSGSASSRIARLNQNGTRDTTFNVGTGASSTVNVVSPQSDNSNIIGGVFTTYSGSAVNRIVKIAPSGSRDTSFNVGTGFGSTVYDMTTQSDGKVIVVGIFQTYSGSASNRIARINTDGTLDTTFNVGGGPNSDPLSIDIQSDGKILALGAFTTYSGSSSNRIVRINTDGTRDTTFNVGTGINDLFSSPNTCKIIESSDNKIYVTNLNGTIYSGSFAGNLIRINSNGTLDTTFVTTSSVSYPVQVAGLMGQANTGGQSLILSGSSIIVVGSFISYKDPTFNRGIMIDSTCAISSSFNVGTNTRAGLGFNGAVRTWATQSDGKILAGGDFTQYSGSSTNTTRIVRLNRDGTRDTSFVTGTGFGSTVFNLIVQPDGKIIAIGTSNTYSGSASNGIVRINTDGTRDTTFNVGTGLTTNTDAYHSAIQTDGKIIVVGNFTLYSGSTSNRIVRINTDGTRDTSFNVGTGFPQNPEAVIIQSDNKILVTGNFTSYSGSAVNRIVRINTNGTRDTTFNVGTGLAGTGYALALQSDNKILVTGGFTSYSGSTSIRIIRINTNGTLDTTFNANANASLSLQSNTANGLAIDSDGKIYWGNAFTTFSGSFTPNRIVRLNTNGSVDETFNQAFPNFVNSTGKGANGTINAILLL